MHLLFEHIGLIDCARNSVQNQCLSVSVERLADLAYDVDNHLIVNQLALGQGVLD